MYQHLRQSQVWGDNFKTKYIKNNLFVMLFLTKGNQYFCEGIICPFITVHKVIDVKHYTVTAGILLLKSRAKLIEDNLKTNPQYTCK